MMKIWDSIRQLVRGGLAALVIMAIALSGALAQEQTAPQKGKGRRAEAGEGGSGGESEGTE